MHAMELEAFGEGLEVDGRLGDGYVMQEMTAVCTDGVSRAAGGPSGSKQRIVVLLHSAAGELIGLAVVAPVQLRRARCNKVGFVMCALAVRAGHRRLGLGAWLWDELRLPPGCDVHVVLPSRLTVDGISFYQRLQEKGKLERLPLNLEPRSRTFHELICQVPIERSRCLSQELSTLILN